MIQLTPALTYFKGPTISIRSTYRRISVIANIENKEKHFQGLKNGFCYKRISITGGSVVARYNCINYRAFLKGTFYIITDRNENVKYLAAKICILKYLSVNDFVNVINVLYILI